MTRSGSTVITLLVVTVVYIVAGKFGLSLAFLNASASPIWPPTGLALAAILLLGYRIWPAIFVGAFVVNLTTAGTVATSGVIAIGNTLEAVLGAMLVQRFAGGRDAFESAPNILRFIFFAAIPSTIACTSIGVSCLVLAGMAPRDMYSSLWTTWWTGDFVSDLVVAPLLMIWATAPWLKLALGRIWEALALALFLAVVGELMFSGRHHLNGRGDALAYISAILLVWAAFRFEQRGAVTAAFALSAVAVKATLGGVGPFATGNVNQSLLLLQTFMGVNTVTALMLAAVVAERARTLLEKEDILQRERVARNQAEQANRAKDRFLATLSHELRTPLTPVLLIASMLENDPKLPDQLREDAQSIRRNVELEARLIDDLLDLTRITRGKLQLNVQSTDVHVLVRRAVDICCADRAHELTLDLSASDHRVRGDPIRLQQVFWNLLSNAVKNSPAGRSIAVRTRNVDQKSMIEVEVSDTGIGIEPEILPRLFNAFEQGNPTGTRTIGGLGLGLTISKGLVEAHGGTIRAQSAGRDAGATFTVQLPTDTSVPERSDSCPLPSRRTSSAASQARILLVEDHQASLEAMARLLMNLGHAVTTASSIKTARQVADRGGFDLLISDLGLPDGSGYELMLALGKQYGLRGVALSGYGMPDDIRLSREAGFSEHLVKPVNVTMLEDTIARVLAAGPSA